ncbi:hypothetical protein, conserved [Angomonas deanei]|uniref:Uncharacterized protein n=1 Tax=Angomonas deanei TaxID=59799 RepID=A0A7G2CD52_9TRYP|nr:hypothetical protein, conserved [Angomonas deanei]
MALRLGLLGAETGENAVDVTEGGRDRLEVELRRLGQVGGLPVVEELKEGGAALALGLDEGGWGHLIVRLGPEELPEGTEHLVAHLQHGGAVRPAEDNVALVEELIDGAFGGDDGFYGAVGVAHNGVLLHVHLEGRLQLRLGLGLRPEHTPNNDGGLTVKGFRGTVEDALDVAGSIAEDDEGHAGLVAHAVGPAGNVNYGAFRVQGQLTERGAGETLGHLTEDGVARALLHVLVRGGLLGLLRLGLLLLNHHVGYHGRHKGVEGGLDVVHLRPAERLDLAHLANEHVRVLIPGLLEGLEVLPLEGGLHQRTGIGGGHGHADTALCLHLGHIHRPALDGVDELDGRVHLLGGVELLVEHTLRHDVAVRGVLYLGPDVVQHHLRLVVGGLAHPLRLEEGEHILHPLRLGRQITGVLVVQTDNGLELFSGLRNCLRICHRLE